MILILEGLPASGKTSLANILQEKYGFLTVNESLGYLSGVCLSDDQSAIFQETLDKYRLAKDSNELVIIDRGYPSLLAWDHCAEKLQTAYHLKEKVKWVEMALRNGILFEPDLYLYLMITSQLSLKRRPRRETLEDVWSGEIGMNYCSDYYHSFFKKYPHPDRVLKVDGMQSLSEIALQIMAKISSI